MARKSGREQVLKEAWIGDAVLSLYVRSKILREDGHVDGDKANRLTSNQMLAAIGEPSAVEAEIGRAFAGQGMAAAYAWIEEHLLPVFERQDAKRAATGCQGLRPSRKR